MATRLVRAAAAAVVLSVTLSGCGLLESKDSERGRGDGPRFPADKIDGTVADGISELPDGFGNVATKCVWDGYRAFVTTKGKGASALVIVVDKDCRYEETGPDA